MKDTHRRESGLGLDDGTKGRNLLTKIKDHGSISIVKFFCFMLAFLSLKSVDAMHRGKQSKRPSRERIFS